MRESSGCGAGPAAVGGEPVGKRETLSAQDRERQYIVDYLAGEAADEAVEHLEKVKTERALGQQMDAWDVHTNKNRWWVITAPTNLYLQTQFPSLEVALSFHVGLMARVAERQDRTARPELAAGFSKAWRAWEQAGDALAEADEAEEFQAVGMRCRESLLGFVKEAASVVPPKEGETPPKLADFVGWANLLADAIASGSSAERKRGYLKATAKSTWELVNWLTHARDASPFDAYFSHDATKHVLVSWSGHGGLYGVRHGSQLRHPATRLPLGLPADISIEPEAVLALVHQTQRIVELLHGNERAAMREKRSFLETERVDRSETLSLDLRVAKPELVLHSIGHRRINLGEARAKPTGEFPNGGFVVLCPRRRHGVEGCRRRAT